MNKPAFTGQNDKGETVNWWPDKGLNEWAALKKIEVKAWRTEINGRESYVLTDKVGVIFESQRLEDVAVHIDIMKLDKTL